MGSSKRLLQQSIRLLKSLVQVKMKLLHLIPALAYVNAEVDLDGFLTNLLATFKYPTYGRSFRLQFAGLSTGDYQCGLFPLPSASVDSAWVVNELLQNGEPLVERWILPC